MKRAFETICLLGLLLLSFSCGGGGDSDGDGDIDADKDKDHIYIPPDGDSGGDGDSSEIDGSEDDGEPVESEDDGDIDDHDGDRDVKGDDDAEVLECDPYTAVSTCISVNYDKDTRRYCEPPGHWDEESCAPGACVTDGASAWCVGKEDSSDGDDEGEWDMIDDDSPQTVAHHCTEDLVKIGLPCADAYACPGICGFTVFCYACSLDGICSVTAAGQGSCAEPSDGDEELDAVEFEAEPEPEPEPEPDVAESECNVNSPWHCNGNVLHYCEVDHWAEADCSPGTCVENRGGAYCQ